MVSMNTVIDIEINTTESIFKIDNKLLIFFIYLTLLQTLSSILYTSSQFSIVESL